jgi:hypothetical protein
MKFHLVMLPFIQRYLDPTEILCEILFGLIMVLTFTLGAGLVVNDGVSATRTLLLAILGCNIAWGIIDGVMHVMSCMLERSRKAQLLKALQSVESEVEGLRLVESRFVRVLEPYTSQAERARFYKLVLERLSTVVPMRTAVIKEDLFGGLAKFWLVFVSTIPAILPFLIINERFIALRVSNGLLLMMLFFAGFRWAHDTNSKPWLVGSLLFFGGLVLVGMAMALGG